MDISKIVWSPELVEEWLEIAAMVERSLPPVYKKGYSGPKWQVLREWYELLWDDTEEQKPQIRPTNEQVSIWEEVVLRWFRFVDSDKDKKIIWLRAMGAGWARIGKKVDLSRQTVAARHRRVIEQLASDLTSLYHKKS